MRVLDDAELDHVAGGWFVSTWQSNRTKQSNTQIGVINANVNVLSANNEQYAGNQSNSNYTYQRA